MRYIPEETRSYKVMAIAMTKRGVRSTDFPDTKHTDVNKVFRRLVTDGVLTRTGAERPYVYHATKAQHAEFVLSLDRPNLRPARTKKRTARSLPQFVQSKDGGLPQFNQTIARSIEKAKSKATDHKDMHWPVDADGNPLWKHTICKGFTGQPHKTNTFTGAY